MLMVNTEKAPPRVLSGSLKTNADFDVADRPSRVYTIGFHVIAFVTAFVIIVSRRPDAVLNAQFFAEDGMVWFSDAYNFGVRSLLSPEASYLHTLTRLIALSSLLVPFALAPLVMNLCAIIVQVLPVNVFLSSRFSRIPIHLRLLASVVYLALPNTYEIDANITTIQWHLALLGFLLLLARPATGWGWRVFGGMVLVLISLDGPMGIMLIPVAAVMWWKRRNAWARMNVVLLVPGAVIQVLSIVHAWHSRPVSQVGATYTRLIIIMGRQIFIPSLLGLSTTSRFLQANALTIVEVTATAVGLALLLYALQYGPVELKLFILFAYAVFALCLARPLAGSADRSQWEWLCVPGIGNRYYFLPMLTFLGVLFWMAVNNSHRNLRYLGVALLLMLPYGIYQDWSYPEFKNLNFKEHAAEFERKPSGTRIKIPVNPAFTLELTKH
jgi:hypothetical protein